MVLILHYRRSKNSSIHLPPFPANTTHGTDTPAPMLVAEESLCDVDCV